MSESRQFRWLFSPQTMFVVNILIFIFLFFSHPVPAHLTNINAGKQNQQHTHRHEMSTDRFTKELFITATDFAFLPDTQRITAHENVKVTLINDGKAEHDFEIEGTHIHIHALPGSRSSDVIHLEKPGIYKAICTLPGHKETGMVASIRVEP